MQISLKQKLRNVRFLQLSLIYATGLIFYIFTHIPHNWWVLLTVLMIMGAVHPGHIIVKSIHRGRGTFIGILLSILLVYLFHFNYRLVSIVLMLSIILMNVPNQKHYDLSVTAMTVLVFLNDAFSNSSSLLEGPMELAINRMLCTIIGIAICIIADYLIFNNFRYSEKMYRMLQEELLTVMDNKIKAYFINHSRFNNRLIIKTHIYDHFNEIFNEIMLSGTGILNSPSSSEKAKLTVNQFTQIAWNLKTTIDELYVVVFINNKNEQSYESCLNKLNIFLETARDTLLLQ